MPKSSLEDYKIRLLLFNEWKSRTSVKEAKKIVNEKLGKKYVTTKKIQKWFKRFNKGHALIFKKDAYLNVFVQNNSISAIDSLLFLTNEKHYDFKLVKCDDRFIQYTCYFGNKYCIVRHDLFLGVKKKIELPSKFLDFGMIDDKILWISDIERKLHLFKPDYDQFIGNLLHSIDLNEYTQFIIADQQNPLKFMVYNFYGRFALGEVSGERIILGDFKYFGNTIDFDEAKRLMGSKFQWFSYEFEVDLLKFCEADLDTMKVNKIDVPANLDDYSLSISSRFPDPYCWSKNRFYGMFEMSDDQYHLLMFNLEIMKWTHIQIVAIRPESLFIDSNEVLTLKVGKNENIDAKTHNETTAFYRFNLRKPDTLKNLVHLAISRQSTLFGNDKYLKCVKRLPVQL